MIEQHDPGEVEQYRVLAAQHQPLGEGLHQLLHALVTEVGAHADHDAVGHVGDAQIIVEQHASLLEGGTNPLEGDLEGIPQGRRGTDVADRDPQLHHGAGVACLWGPSHGGANEACLNMLEDIQRQGGVAKVGEFMEKVKDKNSGVKLMGFGHRVYRNYDPRAKLMQETCNEVLAALGLENDPLFALAKALEKIALEDDYFVSRKLYPNVDFYSGIVQRAIGIPVGLFTGIFALARTVGWIAQLNEMLADPEYKIGRPRQLYAGSVRRDVPQNFKA